MNKERLLQLADHLENGKLGHEVFDFRIYNNAITPECGTTGCAMGECPILWPNHWEWSIIGYPTLSDGENHNSKFSGCAWFDLDRRQYDHLFMPDQQKVLLYGGKLLTKDATRYEVAAGIRAFITKME